MKMTYDEAIQAYFATHEKAYGHTDRLLMPHEVASEMDLTCRWILRN